MGRNQDFSDKETTFLAERRKTNNRIVISTYQKYPMIIRFRHKSVALMISSRELRWRSVSSPHASDIVISKSLSLSIVLSRFSSILLLVVGVSEFVLVVGTPSVSNRNDFGATTLFTLAIFCKIHSASSMRPCDISHLGDSGVNLRHS